MKTKRFTYSAFIKNIKNTIKHYDMLKAGDSVLVAVSGGADSVCLLKTLLDIKRSMGIKVIAANLNHGLRGAESCRDSAFVKKLCKEMKTECVMGNRKVKRTGKKGMSTEERARDARYKFLMSSAKKKRCNVIATGHTMDDQAETVMMKILHGTSLSGLTGIPPVREEGAVTIVRPLIRTERKSILDFLKNAGLSFVEDSSNKDKHFRRNRIRLETLPYLEKHNPKLKRTLVNLSDTLREDLPFIREAKQHAPEKPEVETSNLIIQPRAVRKAVLKALFEKAGGEVKRLTYRHWMDMDVFVRKAVNGKSLNLPGKVRIIKKENRIIFDKMP